MQKLQDYGQVLKDNKRKKSTCSTLGNALCVLKRLTGISELCSLILGFSYFSSRGTCGQGSLSPAQLLPQSLGTRGMSQGAPGRLLGWKYFPTHLWAHQHWVTGVVQWFAFTNQALSRLYFLGKMRVCLFCCQILERRSFSRCARRNT